MPFRICFNLGHPHHHKHCIDIPVIIIDWPRFKWPPPPPDPWNKRFDELVNPELRNELIVLAQIESLAAQLRPEVKDRLGSVLSDYVSQSLSRSLPKDVEVTIQKEGNQ